MLLVPFPTLENFTIRYLRGQVALEICTYTSTVPVFSESVTQCHTRQYRTCLRQPYVFCLTVLASVEGERDSGGGVDEAEDDTLSVIDTSNWAPGCFISRAQSQRAGN